MKINGLQNLCSLICCILNRHNLFQKKNVCSFPRVLEEFIMEINLLTGIDFSSLIEFAMIIPSMDKCNRMNKIPQAKNILLCLFWKKDA